MEDENGEPNALANCNLDEEVKLSQPSAEVDQKRLENKMKKKLRKIERKAKRKKCMHEKDKIRKLEKQKVRKEFIANMTEEERKEYIKKERLGKEEIMVRILLK